MSTNGAHPNAQPPNGASNPDLLDTYEAARRAQERARDARTDAAALLNQAADSLRQQAREDGFSGETLSEIDALATGLERNAVAVRHPHETYSPTHDADRAKPGVTFDFEIDRPLPAFGIVVVIGFVVAWLLRRR